MVVVVVVVVVAVVAVAVVILGVDAVEAGMCTPEHMPCSTH